MNLKFKIAVANCRNKLSQYLHHLQTKTRKGLRANIILCVFGLYKMAKAAILQTDNRMAAKIYLRSRKAFRHMVGGGFTFVSLDEAVVWTTEWIKSFPTTYDLVVGIPRSGMLIASLIALKLGKPLTTPELFSTGQYWMSWKIKDKPTAHEIKNILLVDDAVDNGKSIAKAMGLLSLAKGDFKVTKAALIVNKDSISMVDLYHAVVPHPKLYEWNILHRKIASYCESGKAAFDMDGVICENCPPHVDDNEDSYVDWIKNAKPYLIPSYNIDVIISSRIEKYRRETEEWLARHRVKYCELILWDIPSKENRKNYFAVYKINQLLKHKPDIYFESHLGQAQDIWKATKIPTLCIDEMILFS